MEYTSTKSETDKEYLSIVIKTVLPSGTPGYSLRTTTLATLNTPLTISPLFSVWPFLLSGKFFPISAYENPSKLKYLTPPVRSSPLPPSLPIAVEPSLKRPVPSLGTAVPYVFLFLPLDYKLHESKYWIQVIFLSPLKLISY